MCVTVLKSIKYYSPCLCIWMNSGPHWPFGIRTGKVFIRQAVALRFQAEQRSAGIACRSICCPLPALVNWEETALSTELRVWPTLSASIHYCADKNPQKQREGAFSSIFKFGCETHCCWVNKQRSPIKSGHVLATECHKGDEHSIRYRVVVRLSRTVKLTR